MGDYADDAIDRDFDRHWDDNGEGSLGETPSYIANPRPKKKPKFVSCKYCGQKGLSWKNVDGKWKLSDERGVHDCRLPSYDPNISTKKETEDRKICMDWQYWDGECTHVIYFEHISDIVNLKRMVDKLLEINS